jgi:hypothetical protein
MLTLSEFLRLADETGEPITWEPAKQTSAPVAIEKAIVQSTSKSSEAIVNAYGVNGVSVQIAVNALPEAPQKFDTITTAESERFIVDTVIKHKERGNGAVSSYTCYCKGKF